MPTSGERRPGASSNHQGREQYAETAGSERHRWDQEWMQTDVDRPEETTESEADETTNDETEQRAAETIETTVTTTRKTIHKEYNLRRDGRRMGT